MKYSALVLFIGIFLISCFTYGSNKNLNHHSQKSTSASLRIDQNNFRNSFSSFFSEDFSGGLPLGWQAIDSAGIGVNWHYTLTGTYSTFYDSLSVTGTSAANGYMIYDSDSANATLGGENADLISIPIDCSSHSSVRLSFNEYLIHFNDTATVHVSNNGISWTQFHNSSSGLVPQTGTPNPHYVDIDISSVAANQAAVYIRFNYKADFSFFWMIDDVQLYEASPIDGSIANIIAPATSCTSYSSSEAVTIAVTNNGVADINGGFELTFIVDSGVPVTEIVTDTIAVGASLNYTFIGTADISAPGQHSITAFITLAGDTVLTNDTLTSNIFSGPHIINSLNIYSNGFETNDDLTGFVTEDNNNDSITWNISNVLPNSGTSCAQIASVEADDWYFTTCLEFDSSIIYNLDYYYRTLSSATQANFKVMIGTGQSSGSMTQEVVPSFLVTNFFYQRGSAQFFVSNSGTFYLGLHVQNGDSLVGFSIDDLVICPDSGLGISSINKNPISVYPNPSSGSFYLNQKQNSSFGNSIEIINPLGKLIYQKKTNELIEYNINLYGQPAGIYLLRLHSENGIHSQKISIIH